MKLLNLIILPLILLSFVIIDSGYSAEVDGLYEKVPKHEFSFDGEKIEIIEFLSFYCGHCYHFEKSIPIIKGNFPGKVTWRTVPIYWGKGSPKPGEAYLIAVDAGKGEEMKKALFHAVFVEKRNIGDLNVLEDIGIKLGLGFDFSYKLRSGEKTGAAADAQHLSSEYGVSETPTLIVAGNLKSSPGMFNGDVNLLRSNTITQLRSILKK